MIAGMGWLEGLCPQPQELMLANLCKEFGVMPSQVKTLDDWQIMADYVALNNLRSNYEAWHQMVQRPVWEDGVEAIAMPQDLIDYMLGLMDKAREKYG